MQKIVFTLVLTFVLSSCEKDIIVLNEGNDLSYLNLKGKVKMIEEASYGVKVIDGEFYQGDLESRTETFFNNIGMLQEIRTYRSSGELSVQTLFKFDNSGKLIEKTSISQFSGISSKNIYSYNESGKLAEIKYYDQDDNVGGSFTFFYDKQGLLVKRLYKNEEDKEKDYKTLYHYYENGLLEESISIYQDDDKKYSISNKYKYDVEGRIIEFREFYSIDGLKKHISLGYDMHGNKIKEFCYNKTGELFVRNNFEYNYDSLFNWTQQIGFYFEEARNWVTRKIEYY